MAGRPVRGELGVGLILERDETSAETHGPRQLHLPPKETKGRQGQKSSQIGPNFFKACFSPNERIQKHSEAGSE